jgi:hypothetical protein
MGKDEIICFHCQQSAEKYLKAFLFSNDIEPDKTHNLVERDIDHYNPQAIIAVGFKVNNEWAVQFRNGRNAVA